MENILKKNIDGVNYEIIEMPATRRSIIALQLKQIATGMREGIKNIDSDINYIATITGVLDRIEPEAGAYLLRDIIMNGLRFPVMNSHEEYDACFTENYDHQIELVGHIMEHNFGKIVENIKKKLAQTGILTRISSIIKEEPESKDQD